jgi:hypothetical protein
MDLQSARHLVINSLIVYLVNVYGTRSNIASTTAAGFTFNEVGLRLKWVI